MEEFKLGPLTFTPIKDDTELSITKCDAYAVSVVIPLDVDGTPVSEIGESAFENCKRLREITFPNDLDLQMSDSGLNIEDYAFSGCTSLTSITIPYGVRKLGRGAFSGCSALRHAELPEFIISVGDYAFSHCEALKTITPLSEINEGVFSHCKSLSVFPVSNTVSVISEDAFYHCYGLTKITIPESVRVIEPLAFRSCYSLKSVTFECPDGWVVSNIYTSKLAELDLSDPKKNAEMLSKMDFDDGCGGWRR